MFKPFRERRSAVTVGVVLPNSEHIWDRPLVLVTGKGGVGKTTVVAALGKAAAAQGRRVLVAEVTPESSPSSAVLRRLGETRTLGEEPERLADGLWVTRIEPSVGHKLLLRSALKVRVVVDTAMKSAALRRFLAAAPAFPEIGVLFQLLSLLRSGEFDHIIVDLPATGHAMGLLSFPKTVLKVISSGLVGDALREGARRLTDPAHTRTVVVTLPEELPVSESKELAAGLRSLGVLVDVLLVNQVPDNPFTDEERAVLGTLLHGESLPGRREFYRLQRALSVREALNTEGLLGASQVELPFAVPVEPRARIQQLADSLATTEVCS